MPCTYPNYLTTRYGDAKTLHMDLERDLTAPTAVTEARLVVLNAPNGAVVLNRVCTITDGPAGEVELTLNPALDYGPGKLEGGRRYVHKVVTAPGPLTHPTVGWGRFYVEWP